MAYAIFRVGQPEIAGVLVDNRLSEKHTADAEMTVFPIDGADPDVSEHIILRPKELVITAWISNIDGNFIPAVGERAKQALVDLQTLRDDRQLLDIVSYHIIYEKMAMIGIEATHEDVTTGALQITCTFRQANPVQAQLLPIPAPLVAEASGNPDHGRGERYAASSEENSGRKTSSDSSIAYSLVNNAVTQ